MPAVALDSVSKVYRGGRRALDEVSLEVSQGRVFGLLGPNGAGKTTAIRILATLLAPSSGAAYLMGVDVARRPAEARRLLGFVGQEVAVDDCLSGRENLLLQARLHGLGRGAGARADEVLDQVGLTSRAGDPAESYSGGMRKRLDIASSLLHRPALLVLDEPTLGLDLWSRREIWGAIAALRAESGMTILLTTHYLEEADRLCDEVAILDEGRIKAQASPSMLRAAAGGDRLRLRLSGPAAAVEEAAARAASLPSVLGVERSGDGILLIASSLDEALPALLEEAKAWRARIEGASIERTELADAYLGATGSSPQAPGAAPGAREGGRPDR